MVGGLSTHFLRHPGMISEYSQPQLEKLTHVESAVAESSHKADHMPSVEENPP